MKHDLDSSALQCVPSVPFATLPIVSEPAKTSIPTFIVQEGPTPLTIVGSVAIDVTLSCLTSPLKTTAPGSLTLSLGGVASNISRAAHALGVDRVLLVAAINSKDTFGSVVMQKLQELGMRVDGLLERPGRTASCGVLLDEGGELVGGVADMGIAHALTGEQVSLSASHQ